MSRMAKSWFRYVLMRMFSISFATPETLPNPHQCRSALLYGSAQGACAITLQTIQEIALFGGLFHWVNNKAGNTRI
jgi:hypothetical protein